MTIRLPPTTTSVEVEDSIGTKYGYSPICWTSPSRVNWRALAKTSPLDAKVTRSSGGCTSGAGGAAACAAVARRVLDFTEAGLSGGRCRSREHTARRRCRQLCRGHVSRIVVDPVGDAAIHLVHRRR